MTRLRRILLLAGLLTVAPAAPALAGPSGNVTFSNATANPITLSTHPVKCMFTDGQEGSVLNEVEGLHLAPFTASRAFYIEGRSSSDAKTYDLVPLLQGWLIGPKRDGVTRTQLRAASRALDGKLGSGGLCAFADSLFGVLAYDAKGHFAASIVRVKKCALCWSTSWSTEGTYGDGLRLLVGDGENPTFTVDEAR
jgi:hypothetical protein